MKDGTMDKHIRILNAVQAKVIEHANAQGIALADHFASVDDFKGFVFGLTFRLLVESGTPVNTAYDLVAGDGAYDRLAEETWNAARA